MGKNDIIIIHGTDYKNMAKRVLEQTGVALDIGDGNKLVILKPSLVTVRDPSSGATTHAKLPAGAIEYLQEHDFIHVTVTEGSWAGDRTGEAFRAAGYDWACNRYHVPFEDFQKNIWKGYDATGMRIKLCDKTTAVDYMVNTPVLKGHCQTTVTYTLRNNKGVIPNSERRQFYTLGLYTPIAHLSTIARNDFILVDNTRGDLDFGEGGNPVVVNRVLGFKSPVLYDPFVCDRVRYSPEDVPHITIAERLGVGNTGTAHTNMICLNQASEANSHFKMIRRVQNLVTYTSSEDVCSTCYGSLIYALDRLNSSGFLHKELSHVCTGQGYKGEEREAGMGQCIPYFIKILEGCPLKAVDIVEFLSENWK